MRKVAQAPSIHKPGERGRLIFAMDATASREPTWDRASHIQAEMFKETAALGGLEIQLVYYRGFGECKASGWLTRSDELLRRMTGVFCQGGRTQIEKVLKRAIAETKNKRVNALVFVGDAMEEDVDRLCHLAGQLGMLGVPVFVFHEGEDAIARRTFQQIARLSNGACCRFDASSAQQLRDLLGAVAVFAAGGRKALDDYGRKKGGVVLRITHQVAGRK
ncbi:MAG: VWA domain-containing protein [Proteobacteria bacterium]|nr:VWA domain-containing protein [Pseudomonadota bacterium]